MAGYPRRREDFVHAWRVPGFEFRVCPHRLAHHGLCLRRSSSRICARELKREAPGMRA
jgi:hypothetical protein